MCEVPPMSYGAAACFPSPRRRDARAIFIHYGNQSEDVLQGRPWFPHQRPQGSARSDGGETFQLHCATAAVGQQLVTVSDKYRGLWSPPTTTTTAAAPSPARRSEREEKAASPGSCHYLRSSSPNWLRTREDAKGCCDLRDGAR